MEALPKIIVTEAQCVCGGVLIVRLVHHPPRGEEYYGMRILACQCVALMNESSWERLSELMGSFLLLGSGTCGTHQVSRADDIRLQ